MEFNLRLTFNDGTSKDVVGKAIDIVAFEERFNMSMANLKDNVRVTHLLFMGWHVEKRTGATKDDFDKWLESVDSVEAAEPKK
jgi:hypothetical protein